jgi:ADP-ribose pyrophosphatase YjhB (NUDIX family)
MKEKAAGILFTDGKSILLLRKKSGDTKGKWGLPGGHMESFDKNILDTATREVKEETGLKSIPGKKIDAQREEDPKMIWTSFIYEVKKPFSVKLSSEHDSWKWISIEQLSKINLHPCFKKNLTNYLKILRKKISKNFSEWLVISKHIESSDLQ